LPARSFSLPARSFPLPARSFPLPARSFSLPAQSFSLPARSFPLPARSFPLPARSFSLPARPWFHHGCPHSEKTSATSRRSHDDSLHRATTVTTHTRPNHRKHTSTVLAPDSTHDTHLHSRISSDFPAQSRNRSASTSSTYRPSINACSRAMPMTSNPRLR